MSRRRDGFEEEAARLGLEPSPPPEPLPVIAPEDVHLVCWQAIIPAALPEPTSQSERADLLASEQTVLG